MAHGIRKRAQIAHNTYEVGTFSSCSVHFFALLITSPSVNYFSSFSCSLQYFSQIKQKFDRGEDVDLTDANPHDVAALLKEFFRSLPDPLMTRELFGPILGTRSESLREGGGIGGSFRFWSKWEGGKISIS